MNHPSHEFFRLLGCFQQHQVRYLIVGGLAVNRYGFHRSTGDVDLYLEDSPGNRDALIRALDAAGYGHFEALRTLPLQAGYCEIMMDDGLYADLMADIPGLDASCFDEYLQAATVETVGGVTIRYIGYEHLLQNKKATGRPKDLLDIEELKKRKPDGSDSPC